MLSEILSKSQDNGRRLFKRALRNVRDKQNRENVAYLFQSFVKNFGTTSKLGSVCPKERTELCAGSTVSSPLTGMEMPALILGTWKTNELEVAEKALKTAFKLGYRAIDTATHYGNEMILGCALESALCDSNLTREDIFIITKLPVDSMQPPKVMTSLDNSLKKLRTHYIDLYMINFPAGTCKDEKGKNIPDPRIDHGTLWKSMECLVNDGKARFIGVANFNCNQLEDLMDCAEVMPSNVQIEMHPYFQQKDYRKVAKELKIPVTAFAPFGRSPALNEWLKKKGEKVKNIPNLAEDQCIKCIADKHCKSPYQVILRYLLQSDDSLAVVVGAADPKLICQNFEIFDFTLDEEQMSMLKNLDKGKKSRLFGKNVFKHHFPGVETHPEFPWAD